MQTRKYPRTMQEAFGPYTDNQLFEAKRRIDREDRIVLWGCAIGAVALAFILVFVPAVK